MSDKVALVRKLFEAVRVWDVDTLLELYHPDVELMPRGRVSGAESNPVCAWVAWGSATG